MKAPIILALDTKDLNQASQWISAASEHIDHFKIGLEFFLIHGAQGVKYLQGKFSFNLFLDLKLFDIPNTIKGGVESVAALSPKFLSVHASGGAEMIGTAVKALPKGSITAVTVLTSFSESEFKKLGNQFGIKETVDNLARIALSAGATSLVCSPFEVAQLRTTAPDTVLITPGVRPTGDPAGDQVRVMTPNEAITLGANYVVIGRSITSHWDGGDLKMRNKIDEIVKTFK